jgi:hypothetical protein
MLNDIFSTREVATGIWLLIFIIFVFASSKIRKSAIDIFKAASTPKLAIPFIGMLMYAVLLVFALTKLPIWKMIYIKDIVLWVLFAGVPSCFKAIERQIDEHYFINMIFDNLKYIALVEFFINSFTFHIIVELIMLPAIVFLFMLDTVAGTKVEFLSVKKAITCIIAFLGLAIFWFTFKEAWISYHNLRIIDLLVSFFIPFIFSFFYMPIAYMFAICAKYEILFLRMGFKEPKDKALQVTHRKAVLKACGLSYKKICRFEKEYVNHMYISMQQNEFNDLLKEFKTVEKELIRRPKYRGEI